MGLLCLICSLRTNIVFFLIFFTLVPAFGLLGGTFLNAAQGNAAVAARCQEAAGAFAFVTCLCGWYILLAILLASVDFPLALPSKSPPWCPWLPLTVQSRQSVYFHQGRERAEEGFRALGVNAHRSYYLAVMSVCVVHRAYVLREWRCMNVSCRR